MEKTPSITGLKKDRIFSIAALAICLLAFLFRFLVAKIPAEFLLTICLADDAFYYLGIARNILDGLGSTFDGAILTNGFHPLYMLVCMVIESLWQGDAAVFAVGVFFSIVGAINTGLLYLLGKKIGGHLTGIGAAMAWAFNPYAQYIELMGVEAPLALSFVLISTLYWLRLRDKTDASRRDFAVMGLLVGICFLSRTDTVFFAFALAGQMLFIYRKSLRQMLGKLFLAGGVCIAVISPWLIWNLVVFGRISQDSGRSILQLVQKTNEMAGISLWQAASNHWPYALRDYLIRFVGLQNYAIAMGLILGTALFSIVLVLWKRDGRPGLWNGAFALMVFGIATWIFYNFYFMTQKYWYFLPFIAALSLAFARVTAWLVRVLAPQFRYAILPLIFLILTLGWFPMGQKIQWNGFHNWQHLYFSIAEDIRRGKVKEIGPEAVLGAWNSGIYSAYSGHRVVNLDGVVNPNIYDAIQNREMMNYILSEKIDFLIDHQQMFGAYDAFSDVPFQEHLKFVGKVELKTFAGDILILKVSQESLGMVNEENSKKANGEPAKNVE